MPPKDVQGCVTMGQTLRQYVQQHIEKHAKDCQPRFQVDTQWTKKSEAGPTPADWDSWLQSLLRDGRWLCGEAARAAAALWEFTHKPSFASKLERRGCFLVTPQTKPTKRVEVADRGSSPETDRHDRQGYRRTIQHHHNETIIRKHTPVQPTRLEHKQSHKSKYFPRKQECFEMLQVQDPNESTKRQRDVMDYIISAVLEAPTKTPQCQHQLKLVVHGPGGSGKSVILRAVAHKLRQAGIGVVIAAPTGVAAFNINGITLHSALSLPVTNNSYGKSTDVPPPRGAQLDNMRTLWKHAKVLLLDEFGFVSDELLERIDRHLRLATRQDETPFGGIHVILFGDLYQLPPPHGKPIFAALKHWQQVRRALSPPWSGV